MTTLSKAFKSALNEDYQTAFDLWLPLAKEGNGSAQFNIGFFIALGFTKKVISTRLCAGTS